MPICQKCQQRWSWKQTFKKSFTLNPFMFCPHCGEKQYPTKKSRQKSMRINFIPPLFILVPLFFDVSAWFAISLIVGSAILVLCLYPTMLELSNEEESLW